MMARQLLREGAKSISRRVFGGLPLGVWEAAFPKDVIALGYHMVSNEDLPHFQLFPYKDETQFEADVLFARDRATTYRQVVDHRLRKQPMARNRILFTFDDGFAECYSVIRPILLRHGIDAVFFIITDFLDDAHEFSECLVSTCVDKARRLSAREAETVRDSLGISEHMLSQDGERYSNAVRGLKLLRLPDDDPARRALCLWLLGLRDTERGELDRASAALHVNAWCEAPPRPIFLSRGQVKQLADDGFTIGAHGHNHDSLEFRAREDIEREILATCRIVRDITGQERVPFAFPHSGLRVNRDDLAGFLERNPIVELIFDSGCLRRDPEFIINRVFTDEPMPVASTAVASALRGVWSTPSAWFRAT